MTDGLARRGPTRVRPGQPFARVRRALGPLEPPLHRAWDVTVEQLARLGRRGVVVLATQADHQEAARTLAARLGPGTVGVWVCCRTDVADLGTAGWFVVRFAPETLQDPGRRSAELGHVVDTWRRACRTLEVIDLDGA